ncbi:hypothetical protein ABZP36_017483 [Zizania latifolia]
MIHSVVTLLYSWDPTIRMRAYDDYIFIGEGCHGGGGGRGGGGEQGEGSRGGGRPWDPWLGDARVLGGQPAHQVKHRRGLSNLYASKSKSFTRLAEVAAKEIAMPKNPFNKGRRLLATLSWRRASCSSLVTT